jgi:hypothetical protein
VQSAREAARRMQCSNNLKQLMLGLLNYESAVGSFPPGGLKSNQLAWTVHILPQIEQQNLYDKFDFKIADYQTLPGNLTQGLVKVAAYQCPTASIVRSTLSTGSTGCVNCGKERVPHAPSAPWQSHPGEDTYTGHYNGVMGPIGTNPVTSAAYKLDTTTCSGQDYGGHALQGVLGRERVVRIGDMRDGTSNTFVVGEISAANYGRYRTWMRGPSTCVEGGAMGMCKNVTAPIGTPTPTQFNHDGWGSDHPGGTHFAKGDGSVQFVSTSVDFAVLLSTASYNGGEVAVVQ